MDINKKIKKAIEERGMPKRKVAKLAGVNLLRHTFASYLVMSGVDISTIKELLGHSKIETTMIYSYLSSEHLKKAVDKLTNL